nr:transport membrane protein [Centrolepis aristata]
MEWNLVLEKILGEIRMRCVWILIGLSLTWFTSYCLSEELIFLLALPFLTLPLRQGEEALLGLGASHFVCTQLTEAFSTYLLTSSIACFYFLFPFICHQIWCFVIPGCYGEQRDKYKRLLYLGAAFFSFFLWLTFYFVIPNLWHFLYCAGTTSTNLLSLKLHAKIYDYIMLTLHILCITSASSLLPIILIYLLERLSLETFTSHRRFFILFSLMTAALCTPPDIWYQILAFLLIYSIIEFAIFVTFLVAIVEEKESHEGKLLAKTPKK